jgi:hypothetical protein
MRKPIARLTIILLLVAACCLLAVPGVAGASVTAKYRAEYKGQVKSIDSVFTLHARAYDAARDLSINYGDQLLAISDNHDAQLVLEQAAHDEYVVNQGQPESLNADFIKYVNGFKGKATRYFATSKQQKRFKTACDLLKSGARKLLLLANVHVFDSFLELSSDPPDYITHQAMLGFADEDAAAGHEGVDAQVKALLALL